MRIYLLIATIATLTLAGACNDENRNACDIPFDQQAMFQNYLDNLVLPSYVDFNTMFGNVDGESYIRAFVDFKFTPTPSNLLKLREELDKSRIHWQYVDRFNIDHFNVNRPSSLASIRTIINNFPVDEERIEEIKNLKNIDLSDASNEFARGIPALEYLYYGMADNTKSIVDSFEANNNLREYATILLADIRNQYFLVTDKVPTTGFQNEYISNTGTAAGTTLSQIVNSINEHLELIKNNKLGLPLGVRTAGIPNPQTAEARYSGQSLQLVLEALKANRDYFHGISYTDGTDGLGLDDYLDAAEAMREGEKLSVVISRQYSSAIEKLSAINGSLIDNLDTNRAVLQEVYNDIAQLVVYLKTDMPAALCVSITYVDNPSDSD